MNKTLGIAVLAVVVIAGAFWYDNLMDRPSGGAANNGSEEQQNEGKAPIDFQGPIGVAQGADGGFLTDRSGMTLYVNVKDESASGTIKPTCNSECEKTWIPYLLGDSEAAPEGAQSGVLAKINLYKRTDGKYQYTLGTKPLYRFTGDTQTGDMNGVSGDWTTARP